LASARASGNKAKTFRAIDIECLNHFVYAERPSTLDVPCGRENTMRIAKNDLPVEISAPGAVARLQPGFGDASSCGVLSAEFF